MRKIKIIILIALIMSAAVLPAFADPAYCNYDIHTSIMYDLITDNQRALFDRIYDGVKTCAETVDVPGGMTTDEVFWVIDFIYNEAPELCSYDRWNTQVWGYEIDGVWRPTGLTLAYKAAPTEQLAFEEEMRVLASGFSGESADTGIRRIHDYLAERFTYGTVDGADTQLAYDAMRNNTALCNGYAQSAVLLCHLAGFECSYIDGQVIGSDGSTGGHAWNIAKDSRGYFLFDATWDDAGSYAISDWYGLTSAQMNQNRRPDPEYVVLPNH